jgi:hypothetical protein
VEEGKQGGEKTQLPDRSQAASMTRRIVPPQEKNERHSVDLETGTPDGRGVEEKQKEDW